MVASLEDKAAVHALLDGVDAVVHMGGVSTEQPWDAILAGNIVGMVNLYEAARKHKVRRIVFASSNHVTGFYRQDEVVSPRDPVRPDGFYGLSKAFGENLAQIYWDRSRHRDREPAHRLILRGPEGPPHARHLDELRRPERLVAAALTAPIVGHTVIYGMSRQRHRWWDNTSAATSATARRTAPRSSAGRRGPPADHRPQRDARPSPGRRLRRAGFDYD
jgi:uronate dehydrogenase